MSTQTNTPRASVRIWRLVQAALLAVGVATIVLLIARPKLGLVVLWDVLIPAAPALLVIAPGLWRNICPLGTVSQLPRHLGLGGKVRASASMRGLLAGGSVLLLLALVPARHVGLDDVGLVSAGALVGAGLIALALGAVFAGKSGWCSGLCPVHPVERLYGQRPAVTLRNAHCGTCVRCVEPCPDSTPSMSPLVPMATRLERGVGLLMAGGFAGFVWGWYQVGPAAPDASVAERWVAAYAWPLGAMAVSLAVFVALRAVAGGAARDAIARCFAAGAVSIYYWYKLPALLGLGGSGTVLVDLGAHVPEWSIWVCRGLTTVLLLAWLVARRADGVGGSWLVRPPGDAALAGGTAFATLSVARADRPTETAFSP